MLVTRAQHLFTFFFFQLILDASVSITQFFQCRMLTSELSSIWLKSQHVTKIIFCLFCMLFLVAFRDVQHCGAHADCACLLFVISVAVCVSFVRVCEIYLSCWCCCCCCCIYSNICRVKGHKQKVKMEKIQIKITRRQLKKVWL